MARNPMPKALGSDRNHNAGKSSVIVRKIKRGGEYAIIFYFGDCDFWSDGVYPAKNRNE